MRWRVTLLLLLLSVIVAGVLIENSSWRQVERAQHAFGQAKFESFTLGLQLRDLLHDLNRALFSFQLSNDVAQRDRFHLLARQLKARVAESKPFLSSVAERQVIAAFDPAFDLYLAEMDDFLIQGRRAIRRDTVPLLEKELEEKSAHVQGLAEQLIQAQQQSWSAFFGGSQKMLGSIQRFLLIGAILIGFLLIAATFLIYRAVVDPLRLRLDQTEAIVERQEKLASLGILAGGIAHEIRNPLTAIKFRLFSLRKSLPTAVSEDEDLVIINNEINRLERLVKDFLEFGRPSEPQTSVVAAAKIVGEVQQLLAAELEKRDITLELEPGDGVMIRVDPQQLTQVLINLVQNAAESMKSGGTITLRVRQGAAKLSNRSQPMVLLEVSDTGAGITPEAERRLFDPFFSTKEGGTGLGLAIAARIVEKHGGHIQYSTQVNRGTTFSVVIPRVAQDESTTALDRR
jgi:signal transduction histidine kinase